MRIQQEVASDLTIRQLLNDENRRHKLVTVLLHTLDSMGYTQSLQQLQEQSNIRLQPSCHHQLKVLFQQGKYQQAQAMVANLPLLHHLKQQISQTLLELKLLQLINKGEYQEAIELIASSWPSQSDKQLQFLQMIATAQPVSPEQITNRHLQILQKCQADSFELKISIDQMLKGYLGVNQDTQKCTPTDKDPPCNVIAQSQAIHIPKISFARLHPQGHSLCLLAENNNSLDLSLWLIQGKRIKKYKQCSLEGLGWVNSVQWDSKGQTLSICTYTKIALVEVKSVPFSPFNVISSNNVAAGKLLFAKWSPFDQLYVGGLFQGLTVVEKTGKILHTIRPFGRTRDLVFTGNELMAISATQPVVIKFKCEEQEVVGRFEGKYSFMSINKDQKGSRVAVANKESIYLLDSANLSLIARFNSPDNPKMWKIQVFIYSEWLIIFNQQLTACTTNQKQLVRHHTWSDCQAVHMSSRKMLTVGSKIMLWQSSSQTIHNNNHRNQQKQWLLELQQEGSSGSDSSSSSSQQSMEQEEDDSMEQQQESNQINIEYESNLEYREEQEQS